MREVWTCFVTCNHLTFHSPKNYFEVELAQHHLVKVSQEVETLENDATMVA